MSDETQNNLADLLLEAGRAHHTAFAATNGTDPDWAIWYADYLQEPLAQRFNLDSECWAPNVALYTADNPPATNVKPESIGLLPTPSEWEPLSGVKEWPVGLELWKLMRAELGSQGVLAQRSGMGTSLLQGPEDVYAHFDDPGRFRTRMHAMLERVEQAESS